MQVSQNAVTTPIPGTYWQWRGQSIYYVRSGERHPERPPLLLIHGFGASTYHWRKNISGLCDDFEVWAIDLLGFGRSGKPDWQYGGELWRDQLYDFITQVIGRPVVLAGNSLGGYSALCLASQRPDAAVGLILLNSAGPFTNIKVPSQPNPLQKTFRELTQWAFRQPLGTFLLFQYIKQPSVVRKTLQKVYLDQSAITDELVQEICRPSSDPGAVKVFASMFSNPQGEKVDVLLQQLKCPLLLLWGEADPWMNAKERGAQFRQYYPQLTEHYLRAGHCPHDEVPDRVNELIRAWVLSFS